MDFVRVRRLVSLVVVLATFAARTAAAAVPGLTLGPRHVVVRAPVARLTDALRRRLDDDLARAPVTSVDAALAFALRETDAALRFGLAHATRDGFDVGEREGNCVEYARLFVAVFDRAAAARGLGARAVAVRSDARLFGGRVPWPGWRDHDWVLVQRAGDGHRWFVDASLADEGLGWDVASNVVGRVDPRGP